MGFPATFGESALHLALCRPGGVSGCFLMKSESHCLWLSQGHTQPLPSKDASTLLYKFFIMHQIHIQTKEVPKLSKVLPQSSDFFDGKPVKLAVFGRPIHPQELGQGSWYQARWVVGCARSCCPEFGGRRTSNQ